MKSPLALIVRTVIILTWIVPVILLATLAAQDSTQSHQIPLPSSKVLSIPSPGRIGATNSFPATIALSPDGRYAALLNDGYGTQQSQAQQSIAILDLKSNSLTDFPDPRLAESAHQSYFLGLAFSSDGKHLYASIGSITDPSGAKSGNTGNGIAVYKVESGALSPERFLKIPLQKIAAGKKIGIALREGEQRAAIPYPAGLAVISGQGSDKLLVANNLSDNAVLLDTTDGRVLQQYDLSTNQMIPASFPYTVVATRDGRRAWCSLWNSSKVAELDLEKGTVTRMIPLLEPNDPTAPGLHPTALLLSPDEKLLYVALSNADAVAAVNTASGAVLHVSSTNLRGQEHAGTYPNALAQSADGRRLFVADASLNAVAVFDATALAAPGISFPLPQEALGFIPTDWYPSALAVAGGDLLIATAKGQSTRPNNGISALKGERRRREHPYIPTLLYGSISRLNFSAAENDLPKLTQRVRENNLFLSDPGKIEFRGGANPIRHVIYILKENRTYDQILGDLKVNGVKVGNGDPALTMYGADVTPNEHKLALQFGVLDNFYDSGEVSGDGHDWSNAAITSDYNEKTWQIAYRGHERIYDYQGTVADEFPLELGESDIDAPGTGYMWDNLARHGLSYRDYGEFVAGIWCKAMKKPGASPKQGTPSAFSSECERHVVNKGEPLPSNVGQPHGSPSPWPWPVPVLKRIKATKAALRDHFNPVYPDFNTEYPDQLRADEFLNEFDGFVRARKDGADKGSELPAYVLLYLPDDHTHGTTAGKPRPAASVADNDLAVGRVVDAVSHSPYWDDTAIFIIEDDAQDGADHVDAHRSIALAISKYSPGTTDHPFVDSRFYTTVNMIHTIEALLGLPPMNQNDAYAPVMAPLFSGPGTQPPYNADWSNRDNGLIYQTNPPRGQGAAQSAKMDFTRPDAVNTAVLNEILWRDRMGSAPMPKPKHAVFPEKPSRDKD
ncbi:MAG TPA: phosphoesterase [Terriglobales bacterium]|nr:phosphoesterase [Terriglobales bacterium]